MPITRMCLRTLHAVALSAVFVFCAGSPPTAHAQEEIIEEVIVTGSYIKRKNQADLGSPVDTFAGEKSKTQASIPLKTSPVRSRTTPA